MERPNGEIRRRERGMRIFPNRESVIRLLGTMLMEINEKWTTGRKDVTIINRIGSASCSYGVSARRATYHSVQFTQNVGLVPQKERQFVVTND